MEKPDLKAKQSQSGAPCSPKEKERRKKQEDKSTGEMLESETNIEKLPYRENSAGERNERITGENSSDQLKKYIADNFYNKEKEYKIDEDFYSEIKQIMPKISFWKSTFGDKLLVLKNMYQIEQNKFAKLYAKNKRKKKNYLE